MLNAVGLVCALLDFVLLATIVVNVARPGIKNYGEVIAEFNPLFKRTMVIISIGALAVAEVLSVIFYISLSSSERKETVMIIFIFLFGFLLAGMLILRAKKFVVTEKGFGYVNLLNRVNDGKFISIRVYKGYELDKKVLKINLDEDYLIKELVVKLVPMEYTKFKLANEKMQEYIALKPVYKQ